MKGLLVPLICDMLGARQVAGLAAINAHYFCTTCDLDIDDIDNVDIKDWIMRDAEHVRRIAALWKSARSINDRVAIFDAFGLRWTPLLELKYWDPVRFIVIDTMHALDINLLKHHLRNLFRLSLKVKVGGDGLSVPSVFKRYNVKPTDLNQCKRLVVENNRSLLYELLGYHRSVLYVISSDLKIMGEAVVLGTKWILAKNIARWVRLISSIQNDAPANLDYDLAAERAGSGCYCFLCRDKRHGQ